MRILVMVTLLLHGYQCYDIFQANTEFEYRLMANVTIIPDVTSSSSNQANSQWTLSGILRLQRVDEGSIALKLVLDEGTYTNYEAIKALMEPFKIKSLNESSNLLMQHPQKVIELSATEPIWSANIKRGIAQLFQLEGDSQTGAFISNEFSLFGLCPTEYFVVNNTDSITISKIYDMDRCTYPGGIFQIRSNIPLNLCEQDKPAHAITSRLGDYKLVKLSNSKYLVQSINGETRSNVQASESYYPQFIFTKIAIELLAQNAVTDENLLKLAANTVLSGFTYIVPDTKDATGGRSPKSTDQVVQKTAQLLTELADGLEDTQLNFDEPYLEIVSEIVRLMETMDLDGLKKLYDKIDIGTSYSQETARNLFLEILPRAGTAATVLLTKHLVMTTQVRPTTAVQLLISLPFFISELSEDLVKNLEEFLTIGNDRPDVKHAAVLSYSTIIYKARIHNKITVDQFEKYVKIFFDLFLNSMDYEQQMLYLEAMGNLQLGNVAQYLEPIIKADYSQNTDIRFLAIFATMPTAYTRSDEIFSLYWPIFYSKNTPLQLRVASFTMLLVSSPTPGRLLGLYNVIKNENCPHMINFYRTTVESISETTYSCFSHLKRLILYMRRHLPPAPAKKFWITGNYIFDYKDRKFQLGSMLQTLLIGDRKKDLPLIIFMKFDTEALGRFTGQIGIYIKARGLSDAILDRISKINADSLKMEDLSKILKIMKLQQVSSTPLHLEFIVQFEGKSVLSYYLNQTTFYNLTEGDILNRINTLLRADSHINMQIVRRPFMIKHGFSTLLGTPADIFIESTVITSIRGSTTQHFSMKKLTRNNQIDFRYTSYAVAKIRAYNPVNDIEYSTIREQGFLVYLPLNNEISVNFGNKSMSFSFYRNETITSGLSLKSRTKNFAGDKQVIIPSNDTPSHQFNIEDLGINVLISYNKESSKENIAFSLFETDVLDNAKVFTKAPYSIMQNLLTLVSIIQLNTVHIARDKHLTILLTNQPKSKIEGIIHWESEDLSKTDAVKENDVLKIDFHLLHLLDYNSPEPQTLHKWEFSSKYSTLKNSKTRKLMVSLNRKTKSGDRWKLCVTAAHDAFVYMKKPFTFTSSIIFGNHEVNSKKCPMDKSRVDLLLTYGFPENIQAVVDNMVIEDADKCSKEIIRLSPVPYSDICTKDKFNNVLAITNYDVDLKFERMPEYFTDIAGRIDHILSAMLGPRIDKLNISEKFHLSIKIPFDESESTNITINDISASIPFTYHQDTKGIDQILIDYGFSSSCSLYQNNLNSFAHKHVTIDDNLKRDNSYNSEVLVLAECSDTPRIAVFVAYVPKSNDFEYVKIYVGGHHFKINANKMPVFEYDGETINVKDKSYQFPVLEAFFDFQVTLKDDNILEIKNELIGAIIQYNMESLLSIFIPTTTKGKLCGLCNMHKKSC